MGARNGRCAQCFRNRSFSDISQAEYVAPLPEHHRMSDDSRNSSYLTANGSYGCPSPAQNGGSELFLSFTDAELDKAIQDAPSWVVSTTSSNKAKAFDAAARKDEHLSPLRSLPPEPSPRLLNKEPRQNGNIVTQYAWLQDLFEIIIGGKASNVARDTVRNQAATPLMVVAGTCPSSIAPMQAICFFLLEDGTVDFWWVKPMKSDVRRLERSTLSRHQDGPFKNVPGNKVRQAYVMLADRFSGKMAATDDFHFDIDLQYKRMSITDSVAVEIGEGAMLPYFMWQENWSGAMARQKFIAGKLCYRKGDDSSCLFSRQWQMSEGRIVIAPRDEEEDIPSLLPPEPFQKMYRMD